MNSEQCPNGRSEIFSFDAVRQSRQLISIFRPGTTTRVLGVLLFCEHSRCVLRSSFRLVCRVASRRIRICFWPHTVLPVLESNDAEPHLEPFASLVISLLEQQ